MRRLVLILGVAVARTGGADPGWQAFQDVAAVLQSPRCQNCHISGDAPLQGDEGRRHDMNIRRGADGRGAVTQRCTNCHQDTNTEEAHGPPGVHDWRLPPPATPMAWRGLKAEELCRALTDRKLNGGKDLAALHEHLVSDHLVQWGWNPGPGRKPPPLTHAAFIARFVQWKDAGAPCAPRGGDAR